MTTIKRILLPLLCLISATGFSQALLDSMLSRLQDRNLVLLDRQIANLVSHDLLRRLDPDITHWPGLLTSIVNETLETTTDFDRPARVIIEAHLAQTLVHENQSVLGYALIKKAMMKANGLEGLPLSYAYASFMDIFQSLERLDSAFIYAEKVLDIADELKNDSIERIALFRIALLCYKTKNYSKSAIFFKRLIAHQIGNDREIKDYYNTLALTFRNRKQYDSSRYYFGKAMEFAVQQKDTAWIGLVRGNIAYTYYLQKKYDEALPGLLIDIDYSFRTNNNSSALYTLSTVTNIFLIRSDMRSAKLYYDSLAHGMKTNNNKEVELEFLKTSADYYLKTGDARRSVDYLKAYIALDDSLQIKQNTERASQLEAQFEFDRQVKKIDLLEAQSRIHTQETKQTNNYLIGTMLLVILGAGLTAVQYTSNRYKNKTNIVLQEQNTQITLQAERLHELNATKDKIFSIIGHDLRGPINSLKALLTMVTSKMITEDEFRKFSLSLKDNVEQVHFTLNNLLHWAGGQMKGIDIRQQTISLHDQVLENFGLMMEPAKAKNIALINNVPENTMVLADPDQVRLIFRNLINNAIKFTPDHGQVTVACKPEGNMYMISVTDNGIGIAPEVRQKLFGKDFSPSTIGTKGEKGTGLGLLLCREMIENNGGTIGVISEPGRGTTFLFTLQKGTEIKSSNLSPVL